jgi:hypothetical protein
LRVHLRSLRVAVALAGALMLLAGGACGGSAQGTVRLVWQTPEGGEVGLSSAALQDSTVFRTLVLVSNETGSTLRNARLRFQPKKARNAPASMHVGTVTNIASVFEGDDQLWPVGDLAPGDRLAVPIGLWFNLDEAQRLSQTVELSLALVSPDLEQAVQSNALKVRLAQ